MKNPKTVAGLIALALLVAALVWMAFSLAPTIRETRREMSLTPTPEPAWPLSVLQVTPDPSLPTPEPVLRSGSRGDEVKNLQSRLYALGYYQGEMDGQFGSATREAVVLFQRHNGLDEDGIVGPDTRELLFSPNAKPYAAEE